MNPTRFVTDLSRATSEEALKAVFVRHADFPAVIKEKVDLFVAPVLFEFKYNVKNMRSAPAWHRVLAQALIYVHRIHAGIIHIPMPTHVALVDKSAALLFPLGPELLSVVETSAGWSWETPASSPDKKLVAAIAGLGNIPHQAYDLTCAQELLAFVNDVKELPDTAHRKVVSAANFETVFKQWVSAIGTHLVGVSNPGPYFVADLREDAVFQPKTGKILFPFSGESFQIPSKSYAEFWSLYGRPPASDVQELILAQLHMFAPETQRQTQGAFYTPAWVAEKGVEYLDAAFPGWQEDENTYLWDPCCGSGNLEQPLRNFDRVFMSTLDMNEVGLMKNLGLFPGATIFQFDFLDADYVDLPAELREIIENPAKRLIVLMNPPYIEAGVGVVGDGAHKAGVSFTRAKEAMMGEGLGKAANELFNQFLYRVRRWIPKANVGVFAKLKYISASGSADFRDKVLDYEARGGFVVPGDVFPGVNGQFPISFVVWAR